MGVLELTAAMKIRRIAFAYRTLKHRTKFAKVGKRCRFPGKHLEVDGHVELGDHCRFRDNVVMRTKGQGKILFGTYSGLSYYCIIESTTCVKIGSFTGIAEFGVLRDTNHMVFGTSEHWRLTPHIAQPIVIGDCCCILSRCYIGPGVAIGDGAIIAPGSYVTKDVGPFEVWGGNPAKKLAHRLKGPVAQLMLRKYGGLLERDGVKTDRYGYRAGFDPTEMMEAAEAGINRAALERDRLMEELGCFIPVGERRRTKTEDRGQTDEGIPEGL